MHMDMGPIDPPDVDAVRKDPYHLPPSFEWSDVDLEDSEQTHELYLLLHAAVGRTLVKLRNLIHGARQARELCGGRRQHVSFRCAHEYVPSVADFASFAPLPHSRLFRGFPTLGVDAARLAHRVDGAPPCGVAIAPAFTSAWTAPRHQVGVRVVQTRKLVAFISCTPAE